MVWDQRQVRDAAMGGHMSGFTSGSLGWRPHLLAVVIEEVKKKREGEEHFSKDDALSAFGSTKKDRQIINNKNNPSLV